VRDAAVVLVVVTYIGVLLSALLLFGNTGFVVVPLMLFVSVMLSIAVEAPKSHY
jgi:hypothetical protein